MNNDISSPPHSSPEKPPFEQNDQQLASRGSRLGGAIIDSLVMIVIILPIMYFTGGFDGISDPSNRPSFVYNLAIGLVGLVAFGVINFKLLITSGQTIGKKVVGTKIVTMDGALPTLKDNLLKRYATFYLPGQIPVLGQLFSLVNILFIFGKPQRCIHDYAGDTKVIKLN